MKPEEHARLDRRWREDIVRSITDIQKRLDYIEPREAVGSEILSLFAYGEIYVHDNSVGEAVAVGVGYTKMTQWTTNGQERNMTNDAANDKITITETGIYKVTCSISAEINRNNTNFLAAAFLNGVEQDQIHWRRSFGTANAEGSMGMSGFIDVTTVPWDLDVRFRHDNALITNITVTYGNLNVIYLGPT